MNIQEFKATLTKEILLDPTRFTVNIAGPAGVFSKEYSVMCNAVQLPGRGFGTTEKYTHGPIRKVPYAELYDDVTTTFYTTQDMGIHDYFSKWQILIAGEDYYANYYKDYIGSVLINVEDRQNKIKATYELFEAYPLALSPVELAYSNRDAYSEFTVTWAYHHWEKK